MRRRCLAAACKAKIIDRYLICRRHWSMLPPDLQDEIWRGYFNVQRLKKPPTEAYTAAVNKAKDLIAKGLVSA